MAALSKKTILARAIPTKTLDEPHRQSRFSKSRRKAIHSRDMRRMRRLTVRRVKSMMRRRPIAVKAHRRQRGMAALGKKMIPARAIPTKTLDKPHRQSRFSKSRRKVIHSRDMRRMRRLTVRRVKSIMRRRPIAVKAHRRQRGMAALGKKMIPARAIPTKTLDKPHRQSRFSKSRRKVIHSRDMRSRRRLTVRRVKSMMRRRPTAVKAHPQAPLEILQRLMMRKNRLSGKRLLCWLLLAFLLFLWR